MKKFSYLVIAVLLLLGLLLAVVRLQPRYVLDLAQSWDARLSLEADDLSVGYVPLTLQATQLRGTYEDHQFVASQLLFEVSLWQALKGAPFWRLDTEDLALTLSPESASSASDASFDPQILAPLQQTQGIRVGRFQLVNENLQAGLQVMPMAKGLQLEATGQWQDQHVTLHWRDGAPATTLQLSWRNENTQLALQSEVNLQLQDGHLAAVLSNGKLRYAGVPVSSDSVATRSESAASDGSTTVSTKATSPPSKGAQQLTELAGRLGWHYRAGRVEIDELTANYQHRSLPEQTLSLNASYQVLQSLSRLALQLSLGDARLEGDLSFALAPKVVLRGTLKGQSLHLPPQLSDAGSSPNAPAASDQNLPLFTPEPIDWQWLNDMEVDLNVSMKDVWLGDAKFDQLSAQLNHQGRTLTLAPLQLTNPEANIDAQMSLELMEDQSVSAQMQLVSQGVQLSSFGWLPAEQFDGGAMQTDVTLSSRGNSAHDLASGLNGQVLAIVEDARIQNGVLDAFASDVMSEALNALNPFRKEDPNTEIECALMKFDIEDGVLKSKRGLVVETSKMEIVGGGRVELPSEKIDVSFSPSARAGVGVNVGSLVKFVKLGGSLREPKPKLDALGVLQSGAAVGAALSTGGISVLAEGLAKRALNAGSACKQARKRAQKESSQAAQVAPDSGKK